MKIDGVPEEIANDALRLASYKLSIKTKIIYKDSCFMKASEIRSLSNL
jgi:Ribosomal protein L16/L10E